jgi:hypothetical protein
MILYKDSDLSTQSTETSYSTINNPVDINTMFIVNMFTSYIEKHVTMERKINARNRHFKFYKIEQGMKQIIDKIMLNQKKFKLDMQKGFGP